MYSPEVFAHIDKTVSEQAAAFNPKDISKHRVGEFGTCGGSTWRIDFNKEYAAEGVEFFNPQLPEGVWETAPDYYTQAEAWHLANDSIILIPVTSESYGINSLGEIGFAIMHASDAKARQDVIIYIDPNLDDALVEGNEAMAKLSKSMRKLMLKHLSEFRDHDNIHIVKDLDQMLEISLELWHNKNELNILYA